jgi:hypothetical protein
MRIRPRYNKRKPRWLRRDSRYGHPGKGEHGVIASGHGERPEYSRKTLRMLTRLFR